MILPLNVSPSPSKQFSYNHQVSNYISPNPIPRSPFNQRIPSDAFKYKGSSNQVAKRLEFEDGSIHSGHSHSYMNSPMPRLNNTVKKAPNMQESPGVFVITNYQNTEARQRAPYEQFHQNDSDDDDDLRCNEQEYEAHRPPQFSLSRHDSFRPDDQMIFFGNNSYSQNTFGLHIEQNNVFENRRVSNSQLIFPKASISDMVEGLHNNSQNNDLFPKLKRQQSSQKKYELFVNPVQQKYDYVKRQKQIREDQLTAKKKSRKIPYSSPLPVPIPQTTTEKKKTCNCKQSKCLKLYCDCFGANQFCGKDCNCVGCSNNEEKNDERIHAMQQICERNKQAFDSKVQVKVVIEGQVEQKHYKGCNCKKSGCRKKYCECYQNNVTCSELCKCTGCENCDIKLNKKKTQKFRMHIEEKSFRDVKKIKSF